MKRLVVLVALLGACRPLWDGYAPDDGVGPIVLGREILTLEDGSMVRAVHRRAWDGVSLERLPAGHATAIPADFVAWSPAYLVKGQARSPDERLFVFVVFEASGLMNDWDTAMGPWETPRLWALPLDGGEARRIDLADSNTWYDDDSSWIWGWFDGAVAHEIVIGSPAP